VKFNTIWSHILDNKPFYSHLSIIGNYRLDMDNQVHYDLDSSSWSADPVLFMVQCFRKYDITVGGTMAADEYLFIKNYLLKRNVAIPFSRSEYNEYVVSVARSNTILSALENGVFMADNKFVVPSQEVAKDMFGVAYEYVTTLSSDLFLYTGMDARCVVDIYDFVSGFEVYTGRGNVFIPMYGTIESSAYVRSGIRSVSTDDTIKIFEDSSSMLPSGDGFISVPMESMCSVSKVSKYFSSFTIDSDKFDFILGVSSEISKGRDTVSIVVNSSMPISEYMFLEIMRVSEDGDSLTYSTMFKSMLKMSSLAPVDKEMIVSMLIDAGKEKSLQSIITALRVSPDRLSPKIRDMVLDSNIVLVSRQSVTGGDGGSIKIFNKVGKYFKDIPMESKLLVKHIIPELGGFAFIERYCDITIENIPKRFKTIEAFISSSVVSVVHEMYQNTQTYKNTVGIGSHYIGGTAVFNAGNEVYGLSDMRSIDGTVLEYKDIDFQIPSTKPTLREVGEYIEMVKESVGAMFSSADGQSDALSILLVSTLVSPLLTSSSRVVINMTSSSPYREAEIKSKIFRGVYRAVSIINIASADKYSTIGGKDTIPSVFSIRKKDKTIFLRTIRIRDIEESVLGSLSLGGGSVVNPSPLFMFTDDEIDFEDLVMFKFKINDNMNHDRVVIPNDVSPFLISYVIKTANVFRRIEEDMLKIRDDRVSGMPMYLIDEYMEFFSKVVAGMVLCSHSPTGYTPLEFHDILFKMNFADRSMSEKINMKELILEIPLSKGKVVDKILDSKYRMDEVDNKTAFVDKAFHIKYVDRDNTRISVVMFNKRVLYEYIARVTNLSYVEFVARLEKTKGYLDRVAALKSYRIGRDKSMSVMKKFVEIHGNNRDEFGAMRYDENADIFT